MGNLKTITTTLFFVMLGCGRSLPIASGPSTNPVDKKMTVFEGEFMDLNGDTVDFSLSSRPFVLIFASNTCTVCTKEARQLSKLFRESGGLPTNVDLATVLIGASPEDAHDWIDLHQVTWLVGIDSGDSLFRKYCPEQKTPCILTYVPETGNLTKFVGGSSPENL
jgi:hypothetical protein